MLHNGQSFTENCNNHEPYLNVYDIAIILRCLGAILKKNMKKNPAN